MPADDGLDVAGCVERVRGGDDDAARALVTHLYPLVTKIIRAHLPRRMAEEDLAQEIFVKMFNRLDQYRRQNTAPFEHWVSRIAVTTCLDALRAEKRRPEWRWADLSVGEAEWLEYFLGETAAPTPADTCSARELMQKLLQELSPEDRLVLSLLDLEQRSVSEISEITGWSASLVKVRAFRARRKLRQRARHFRKGESHE